MRRRCLHCGHPLDRRTFCTDCEREFACGEVGEPCKREGCGDKVLREEFVVAGPSPAVAHEHPRRA